MKWDTEPHLSMQIKQRYWLPVEAKTSLKLGNRKFEWVKGFCYLRGQQWRKEIVDRMAEAKMAFLKK